jgi:hypothetical protein
VRPLLELLDAPWMARRVADSLTPTVRFEVVDPGRILIVTDNGFRVQRRELITDGEARERTTENGRRVVSSAWWTKRGEVVAVDRNHLDDGRILEVTSTWKHTADALVLEIRAASARIKRVFRSGP